MAIAVYMADDSAAMIARRSPSDIVLRRVCRQRSFEIRHGTGDIRIKSPIERGRCSDPGRLIAAARRRLVGIISNDPIECAVVPRSVARFFGFAEENCFRRAVAESTLGEALRASQ